MKYTQADLDEFAAHVRIEPDPEVQRHAYNTAMRYGANIFINPNTLEEELTDLKGKEHRWLSTLAVQAGSAVAALILLEQLGVPVAAAASRWAHVLMAAIH